ncbi:ribose transport system permease protein [Pseudoalteromonas citrea]|uniref:Autoinducer 2 import system permease protein LsrD n=2 Tax=Pseudoalteromonas citrea TaxID=43655 RepID=A0AAD4FR28_9GAMM|nr:ABC transporter permease [Pseudoalteromonas citrea]KAF7768768.1 ribose transport system permease protein [Pseudoalteromonas citrea]
MKRNTLLLSLGPLLRKKEWFVYYLLVVMTLIFSALLHDSGFFSSANFINIMRQTAPVMVMALGLSFALSVRHIDVSIGAVVALSAVVCGLLLREVHMIFAILGALSVGLFAGVINGLLIEYLKTSSLLVTLGTMSIMIGIARSISGLESIPITNEHFIMLFGSELFMGIPTSLYWVAILALVAWLIVHCLTLGRHLLAVGKSPENALQLTISPVKVRMLALVMCSLFAAFAGLLYAARMQSARYALGEFDLLNVFIAVAIGSTQLVGNQMRVIGVICGALLIGLLNNGLILLGFTINTQLIVKGLVLVMVITLVHKELNNAK